MTHIDFYILQDAASESRWHFVCRLVDKAMRMGHQVLVAVDTASEASELDELLWTFKPESFIPHQCLPGDKPAPVEIIVVPENPNPPAYHHGLLVNLGSTIPAYFSRFERLSEVVIQSPEVLKNTRDHYSFYRERGYPIQHRQI